MKDFREKLAEAMVGHAMAEVTVVLVDALGAVLSEADAAVREKLIEETCAQIARKAMEQRQ